MKTDIFIVGTGCSGLYCALKLPQDKQILLVTKSKIEESDSFLAQGGMCMLKDESDYQCFYEDTMKAGHYENDKTSVDLMIRGSVSLVQELLDMGADFAREEDGSLAYTREGAHREKRIIFHEDITGQEITSTLLRTARTRRNIQILEETELVDLLTKDNECFGGIIHKADGETEIIEAHYTVLATGGIGGLFRHSTNYRHLTGDGLALAMRHNIRLKNIHYIQIHPTTLYCENQEERSFLISESVRGEGAKLYDKEGNRFVDELLPRDLLTQKILAQMEKDQTNYVWEDLRPIPEEELRQHFPNIVKHCLEAGYDVTKECIPVVPAQHYFMGGIWVNHESQTSMDRLYAIGETACNGVHGRNRLASNSLLESLVFAGRAAADMAKETVRTNHTFDIEKLDLAEYKDLTAFHNANRTMIREAIEKAGAASDSIFPEQCNCNILSE